MKKIQKVTEVAAINEKAELEPGDLVLVFSEKESSKVRKALNEMFGDRFEIELTLEQAAKQVFDNLEEYFVNPEGFYDPSDRNELYLSEYGVGLLPSGDYDGFGIMTPEEAMNDLRVSGDFSDPGFWRSNERKIVSAIEDNLDKWAARSVGDVEWGASLW